MRKTPIRHDVKKHKREGKNIRSHSRGRGSNKRISPIVGSVKSNIDSFKEIGDWHKQGSSDDKYEQYYRGEDGANILLRPYDEE